MKAICKHCNESFDLDKYSVDLIELGEITLESVSVCNLCLETLESPLDADFFSDADPGL